MPNVFLVSLFNNLSRHQSIGSLAQNVVDAGGLEELVKVVLAEQAPFSKKLGHLFLGIYDSFIGQFVRLFHLDYLQRVSLNS